MAPHPWMGTWTDDDDDEPCGARAWRAGQARLVRSPAEGSKGFWLVRQAAWPALPWFHMEARERPSPALCAASERRGPGPALISRSTAWRRAWPAAHACVCRVQHPHRLLCARHVLRCGACMGRSMGFLPTKLNELLNSACMAVWAGFALPCRGLRGRALGWMGLRSS